jgi:hypothetical protein
MKTSYGDFFGSLGEPKPKMPASALDGVIKRKSQRDLEQWKEIADESEVQTLADACRSLRYFGSGETPPTTYLTHHCEFRGYRPKSPPERINANNISKVPLGSIYRQSESEAIVAKRVQEQHDEHLLAAVRRQSEWKSGTVGRPAEITTTYFKPPEATLQKGMKEHPPSKMTSLVRESWTSFPHSKVQVKRHDHQFIKPGEFDWNMCGVTGHSIAEAIYDLRDPKLFPGGGAPHRGRLVTSKMARNSTQNPRLLSSTSVPSL